MFEIETHQEGTAAHKNMAKKAICPNHHVHQM
jgi:hypothetical protein